MKRMSVVIVVLCCAFYAIAAGPSQTVPLTLSDPKAEIAKLEDLIAKAKATGQTPDPAWTARIRELIPSVKGHASKVPADLQAFQSEGGFAPGAVIRPTELTPLEAQIKELEFHLSGGMSLQGVDEVTFANLKEQLNELYAQRPVNRERNPLDQGNDVCPGTVIGGVPYSDGGTTVGFANNYNPISDCAFSDASDVVYEFTPQVTQTYNISLLGSSYDTYLHVNTNGGCPGTTQVACNDDYFSLQSFVSVILNGGQTYYIIVDGFDVASGNYVLNITDNCDVVCQPSDVLECAEVPGPGFEVVDCNGSCQDGFYGGTESWQDILPFQTVCGRGFTYLTSFNSPFRDVDSYRFTIFEPCSLALTINAEFASQMYVFPGSCPYSIVSGPYDWQYSCSTATFLTQCLQPGTYSLIVLPASQTGLNTPRDYRARVDLVPCSGCQVDSYFQAPGSAAWNTCGAGDDNTLRPSEDYTYAVNIPYAGEWTFSTCNDDSIWDSYIYLSGSCNGGVIAQDDDGCGGVGLSTINCVHLNPGIYYLTVEAWSSGCGPFVLNVFECIGSCCYGNPDDPGCNQLSQGICDSLGGVWTYMEPCSSGACFTRPTCATAGAYLSQLPMLPDEPWNANLSDGDQGFFNAEDYLVGGPIGTIRFWGVFAEQGACNTDPHNFQITFFDSVNNTSQVYNVTLTGTPKYLQWNTYRILEYSTELNPPCTILNGDVQIAEQGSGCNFYWSYAITGYGSTANGYWVGQPPFDTGTNLAFCLGGQCLSPDSVTIELYPNIADAYTLRWWQPEGVVHLWWSANPNAVFPATYTQMVSGYVPGGLMNYSFYAPDPSNEIVYVLTVDCSNIAIQNPGGDVPMLQINQPPVPLNNPVTR